MKQNAFLLIGCIMAFVASAQDNKSNKFVLEANVGMMNTLNYSSVSLFSDATPHYTFLSEGIFVGMEQNGSSTGLSLRMASSNTLQPYQEKFGLMSATLTVRKNYPLCDMFSLCAGANAGVSMLSNNFTTDGTALQVIKRYAFIGELESGVIYHINAKSYFRASGLLTVMPLRRHDYILPDGAVPNHQYGILGFQLMLTAGMRL